MALLKNSELTEMLKRYATPASKKAFLTRELKAARAHHKELASAYERRPKTSGYGWYLGDRIYMLDVKKAKIDVDTIIKYKNQL